MATTKILKNGGFVLKEEISLEPLEPKKEDPKKPKKKVSKK